MPFDRIGGNEHGEIFVNGILVESEERPKLLEWFSYESRLTKHCPDCGAPLYKAHKSEVWSKEDAWAEEVSVAECPRCTFWSVEWYEDLGVGNMGCPTSEWEGAISKLREFNKELPSGCQSELARYLRIKPDLWTHLSPKRMEQLVADIFRVNYSLAEVTHVGRPGDGGMDVLMVETNGNEWLIQAKCRKSPDATEGVGVVRNVLGAMVIEDKHYGAIVSNADHFTYCAYKAAEKAARKGYVIDLVDRGKLDHLVGPLLPAPQWADIVLAHRPEWKDDLKGQIHHGGQMRLWSKSVGEIRAERLALTSGDLHGPTSNET